MGVSLEQVESGGPAIGITVDGLGTSTPSRIAVWRQISGQARTLVQGLADVTVTGAGYWVDHLPPLGRDIRYMVEVLEGDAMTGGDEATTLIPSTTAWLQDALNPLLAIEVAGELGAGHRVAFTTQAFSRLERAVSDRLITPLGARLPVGFGSRRRAPQDIPLDMVTEAAEAAALLREVLEESTHLVLRVPPAIRQLDAVVHLRDVQAEELPSQQTFLPETSLFQGALTTWEMRGTQTRGPRISAYTALWTYDDVQELYDNYTYTDLMDGRRYVDWQAHPDELDAGLMSMTGGGASA